MNILNTKLFNSLKEDFVFNAVVESAKKVSEYDNQTQYVAIDTVYNEIIFDNVIASTSIAICSL